VISRDAAAVTSAGISKPVSRNGATTCPTIVSSVPAVRAELGMDGASVMDEHAEPVMGGAEVAGEGTDRIEVLQIGQAVADADAAGRRGDAAPGPLSPAAVPGEEVHRRTGPVRRRPRTRSRRSRR